MSNLTAYGHHVIVRERKEEVSPSGLHIVRTDPEKYMYADVISVGSEVRSNIEVGDVVLFEYWAGASYGDYIIVLDEVILAVVGEEQE